MGYDTSYHNNQNENELRTNHSTQNFCWQCTILHFFMRPTVRLVLLIFLMWCCLWKSTLYTRELLKKSVWWVNCVFILQENNISAIYLFGSRLKFNFHWVFHLHIKSGSIFIISAISDWSWTMEISIVSSAKNFAWNLTFISRSLIKIKIKKGPKYS